MDDPTLSRRDVLKVGAFGATVLALPLATTLSAKGVSELPANQLPRPYARQETFVQPPALRPGPERTPEGRALITVTQSQWPVHLLPDRRRTTDMWVYNRSFPGPTIKVRQNEPVTVRQINALPPTHPLFGYPFTTSTHLHGSPSLPQFDGYANDTTPPGFFKDYEYDNQEDARTLWYHDHAVHHTANNVFTGLAAQYHLLTAQDPGLGIPSDDDFDLPLIIGDTAFRSDGQLLFDDRSTAGVMGDVILVNGIPWPAMPVQPRRYRFRILNASVARSYLLQFSDTGVPMTVFATDGGLLPAPARVPQLKIGMAERYEVIVDFTASRGRRVELLNLRLPNTVDFDNTGKVMAFDVQDPPEVDRRTDHDVPASLPEAAVMKLTPGPTTPVRRLRFERQNGQWTINGHTWEQVIESDFTDVIADPALNSVEVWELQNDSGGWFHPIHVHLVDFKILSRNGQPPAPYERGPKDVVYLGEGQTIRLITRFGPKTGRYMMHCHNTSHEDHDMMFQYRVTGGPDPDPITTAPPRPVSELPPA